MVLCVHAACAETEWEKYLANPTPQQAERVNRIEASDNGAAAGSYELQILQNQVLAQDGDAFRLAYRLFTSSDGGLAEDLGALLGRAIRVQPQFFLQQIQLLNVSCSDFVWVLNMPGLEYSDRADAQRYEIEMRKEALRSVMTAELVTVRDQCLGQFGHERSNVACAQSAAYTVICGQGGN